MTVSKSWAYLSEFGGEIITADQVARERKARGGKPLHGRYWSNHQTGLRVPMFQRQVGETSSFCYWPGTGGGGGGPGESLSHRLLKQAIANMAGTKLKLGPMGEHDIEVIDGETEKVILDGPYRADAYLRFRSSSPLSLRWGGEVYIEVHHEHEVPVEKQDALNSMRAPVIEVPMQEIFLYGYDDDTTNDALEAQHVAWLCNLLQKGFLMGTVISDRKSVEYLEGENKHLRAQLQRHARELAEAKEANKELSDQATRTSARVAELERLRIDAVRDRAAADVLANGRLEQRDEALGEVARLKREAATAQATIADQGTELKWWHWGVGSAAALLLTAIIVTEVHARFFAEPTISAAENTVAPQPAATQPAQAATPKPSKRHPTPAKRASAVTANTDQER